MLQSNDENGIKSWVNEQVWQARIKRARDAIKGACIEKAFPNISETLLLEIASNLENPKQLMTNTLLVYNDGRRRHQIQRFA